MGKDKGQRTKGNLQPSSSGRAAQLVTRDGSVSFTGFDGLGGAGVAQLGYVPVTVGGAEDVESSIDPEFRMVMRKLTKRDAVTKLKAVQEFTELCKSSYADAVEGVLPFWPRIYNRLAMDTDHRVREAAQLAMEQLVSLVGRNLAPHLKSVIGVWLCAQYDTYAPVASAAVNSFQAAFSDNKRIEAIMFCRKELLQFLQDNLLTHTADTLSDPKLVSEEERVSKYNRTVSSSLHTLGHVISILTPQSNLKLHETYSSILGHKKLWKFAKHKSPHIRGALFALVATCCQKLPDIIISLSAQVSPVILGSLDDCEPAVSKHLWNAVLSVLQCMKDCWSHVNIRKAVLPKLWLLLRSGGSGSASVIYPSLLPFMSQVPSEITWPDIGFYKDFFTNLQEGLQQEKVMSSPSECAAVVSAFMECLRFALLHTGVPSSEASCVMRERQQYLIDNQLLPLLRISLESKGKLAGSTFHALLADFLSFLALRAQDTTEPGAAPAEETLCSEEKPEPRHGEILGCFWQGCTSVCLGCVQSEQINAASLESVAQFLVCLKSPARKQKHKVIFLEDKLSGKIEHEYEPEDKRGQCQLPRSIKVENFYNGHLLNLVCKICIVCLTEIVEHNSLLHVRLLPRLTEHFMCEQLIKALLVRQQATAPSQDQSCGGNESYEDQCVSAVDYILLPLVTSSGNTALKNTNFLSCVTDIIYDVIGQMPKYIQTENLNKVLEADDRVTFFRILVEKGCQQNSVSLLPWLQGSLARRRVCDITKSLFVPESDGSESSTTVYSSVERRAAWKILELCLPRESQTESLLDDETTDVVLQFFLKVLQLGDRSRSDDLLHLLVILQSFIKSFEARVKEVPSCLEEILLSLFELHLSQSINSDASKTLMSTWEAGVCLASNRSAVEGGPDSLEFVLISRAAQVLRRGLEMCDDLERIKELAEAAVRLTDSVNKLTNRDERGERLIHSAILQVIIPTEDEFSMWRDTSAKVLWEVQPVLEHRLPIVTPINKSVTQSEALTTLTKHQKMTSFVAFTMKILTEMDSRTSDVIWLVLEMMWLRQWCLCVSGFDQTFDSQIIASSKQHSVLLQCFSKLDEHVIISLAHVKRCRQTDQLISEVVSRSKLRGNIWALVLSDVFRFCQAMDTPIDTQVWLGEVQGLASGDELICQTLVCLLPSVQTIYDVKVLQEQYTGLLSQDKDNTGMALSLSVVAACLRRWPVLAGGREEALLEYELTLLDVLDQLVECKDSRGDLLLFSWSVDDLPMSQVSFNCSLAHVMELAIEHSAANLKSVHWDFILCSLASWLQMCAENSSSVTNSAPGLLLCDKVCGLHSRVVKFFSSAAYKFPVTPAVTPIVTPTVTPVVTPSAVTPSVSPDDPLCQTSGTVLFKPEVAACSSGLPPNLVAEWEEFFSATICHAALNLFLDYSKRLTAEEIAVTLPMVRLAESLGRAVVVVPVSVLKEHQMEHAVDGDTAVHEWSQQTLARFLPYLKCQVHSLQIASYHILMRAMPELVCGRDTSKSNNVEQEDETRSPPSDLMGVIGNASLRMSEILSDADVPFGECLYMASDLEARNICLTLMLAWKLLLALFRGTNQELRAEYAAFLRKSKAVAGLLGMLFRVMPLNKGASVVVEEIAIEVEETVQERTIHELCCSVYHDLLQWMPAMVRQWWNGLDKRRAAIVDRFTASFITPILCQQEMQLVQNSSRRFDDMNVKARPNAREVAAVYTVDEISMELVVKLAPNHPLGVVTVESGRKVGVTNGQWRSWMLQMTTFLTHQNGSIMDGLILWKRNVDKRFEGVDDCMICFSVIHASNYSLPKLTCKTCKKRFHSICLYKWFSTSNNSTCPLCRNLF